MNLKTLLLINTAVFGVGFLVHLSRVLLNKQLIVAGFEIPALFSVVAVVFTAFMAYQNYSNIRKK